LGGRESVEVEWKLVRVWRFEVLSETDIDMVITDVVGCKCDCDVLKIIFVSKSEPLCPCILINTDIHRCVPSLHPRLRMCFSQPNPSLGVLSSTKADSHSVCISFLQPSKPCQHVFCTLDDDIFRIHLLPTCI